MQIKKYSIASFILMALIGWYVYAYVTQESMGLDIFGVHMPSISIAAWIVIAMFIFYLASVFHMLFYSMLGNFKHRKYSKDFDKTIEAIADAYLGKENRAHTYKTQRYELIGRLIDNTSFIPNKDLLKDIENEKIKDVLETIENINNGDVVDIKKYNLSKDNPLTIKNTRNRYKNGDISAEDILNNHQKHNIELCKEVYKDYVKDAPIKSIEKHCSFITKEALFDILSRINIGEDGLEIPNETLIFLFNKLELTCKDYIEISKMLSKSMVPDQRITLFEKLSNEKEEVMSAYLYTLFDLEMIELADEILLNSQESEYLNFKAYSALKEHNKNFNIDIFI